MMFNTLCPLCALCVSVVNASFQTLNFILARYCLADCLGNPRVVVVNYEPNLGRIKKLSFDARGGALSLGRSH